jgi:hypothetical protein
LAYLLLDRRRIRSVGFARSLHVGVVRIHGTAAGRSLLGTQPKVVVQLIQQVRLLDAVVSGLGFK